MRHRIPRRLLRRQLVPLRIRPYGAFFPPNAAPPKRSQRKAAPRHGKERSAAAGPTPARPDVPCGPPGRLGCRRPRPPPRGLPARLRGQIGRIQMVPPPGVAAVSRRRPRGFHAGDGAGGSSRRELRQRAAVCGRYTPRTVPYTMGSPVPMGPIGHSPAGKGMEEKSGDLWKSMWKTTGFVDIFRMTHKILVTTAGHQYRR